MRGKFPRQAASGSAIIKPSRKPAQEPDRALVDALLTGMAASTVGIALYDQHDRLQFANDEFRRAFAIAEDSYPAWEDIIRRSHAERVGLVVNAADIDDWLADVRTRRRVMRQRSFECDLVDGGWYRMHETMTDDDWMLCVANDITALKSNERVLQNARDNAIRTSQMDELTGCYNRRFIFAQFEDLLGRQKTPRMSLSVAVLDLDHFKAVNDSYGHQTGDEMLKHFCNHARVNLRPQDWLGRTGGEEFLLLLPDTSPQDAVGIVARLRTRLESKPLLRGQAALPCRFCAGIALARKGESLNDIYRRADQALYQAKESGRNQDVVADESDKGASDFPSMTNHPDLPVKTGSRKR